LGRSFGVDFGEFGFFRIFFGFCDEDAGRRRRHGGGSPESGFYGGRILKLVEDWWRMMNILNVLEKLKQRRERREKLRLERK
jgi:hypothetical protein